MKKRMRRGLSFLLALVMVLGLLPAMSTQAEAGDAKLTTIGCTAYYDRACTAPVLFENNIQGRYLFLKSSPKKDQQFTGEWKVDCDDVTLESLDFNKNPATGEYIPCSEPLVFQMPYHDVTIEAVLEENTKCIKAAELKVVAPKAGDSWDTVNGAIETPTGADYNVVSWKNFRAGKFYGDSNLYKPYETWSIDGHAATEPFTFEAGKTYTVYLCLVAKGVGFFENADVLTVKGDYDSVIVEPSDVFNYQYWDTLNVTLTWTVTNDLPGTVTLSDTPCMSTANPTLSSGLQEKYKNGELNFQWQIADSPNGIWTDIVGANGLSYYAKESDYGRFIRLEVTEDGFTGSVASNAAFVGQCNFNFKKPENLTLTWNATDGLMVRDAKATQEYLVTTNATAPDRTDAKWDSAVSPSSDGLLKLDATPGQVVYVHTRVKETPKQVAGFYTAAGSIYTGQTTALKAIQISSEDTVMQVGDVMKLNASPVPSNATGWSGGKWYVNEEGAALYTDAACTQLYIKDTIATSVYVKATSQNNDVEIGCEKTVGYNELARGLLRLDVKDTEGYYALKNLVIPEVKAAPGEQVTVNIGTNPEPAKIGGALTFVSSGTIPAGIGVTGDAAKKTVTVSVAENMTPGTFFYAVKVNGADTNPTSFLTVTVLDDQRTIPVESISVLPETVTLTPGSSAKLRALVTPTNATAGSVIWSSSSDKIKVDSATGLITATADSLGTTATITAACGGKSASCKVTVLNSINGIPVITQQPEAVTVSTGGTATFRVAAVGEELHYQWYRETGSSAVKVGTDSPTYTVTNANLKDYGTDCYFYCAVSNEMGMTISERAQLTINLPFVDVPAGEYYAPAVAWAVANGITAGTSDTTFSPKAYCTRDQVVTFLWRTKGEPAPTITTNPFKDVKSGAYYYKAVLWAVEKGITAGTGATTFSPGDACTRAQVVTFLWRMAGEPAPKTTTNPFTDVKSSAYYYKAVLWAVENGITAGTSSTKFSPGATCTRAQIVTFLYRAYGK